MSTPSVLRQSDRGRLPLAPQLARSEVHVVQFDLDGYNDAELLLSLLDVGERARASSFVFDRDRRRFVVGHALTRVVLGRYLQVRPATLRFGSAAHGKPSLLDTPFDLRFNLSHSAERAILAISLGCAVGIDIERERSIEVLQMAQHFFSRVEQDMLMSIAPGRRLQAFFRCWTRKESFIKAHGAGLSFPLEAFDVELDEGASAILLACRHPEIDARLWQIISIAAEPGYAAALTVDRTIRCVVNWEDPRL